MKYLVPLFILLSILSSCWQKHDNDMELLNDIFLELVGTEYYYEELPAPPMPLEYAENKQDSINYQIQKRIFDEAYDNPKLDTAKLVLGVAGYHVKPIPESINWSTQETFQPRMYYPDSLHSKDYDKLLLDLADSTVFDKGEIDLAKLTQTGKYIIKDLDQLEKQNKEYWKSTEYRYIASLRFSDFRMNEDRNKAVFYYDFLCGPLCGAGEIIVCSKVNGKWKILYRNMLWVS